MSTRSFWRTYNWISAAGCAALGVVFVVAGVVLPVTRFGMWIGALACFGVAAALAAWAQVSKDLIPDVPMMGPTATLGTIAAGQAHANAMMTSMATLSPYPDQVVAQLLPGQARVDRADDTGFSGPGGRTYDLHLTVTLAGRTPYRTMVREVVPPAAVPAVVPGAVLGVRGNPDNHHQLVVALPGR